MKATPWIFLAVVGLMTVAIAMPERVEPPKQTQPLDGDGIVVLRVDGDVTVTMEYSPDCDCDEDEAGHAADHLREAPYVRWPSDGDGRVDVRRDGDTLVLKASGFDGETIDVLPPPGVRMIDVPGGRLHSGEPLPSMTVRTRESFHWIADTERLEIVQSPTAECLAEDFCHVAVEIVGTIGDVAVEAGLADVDLQFPHRFGGAVVRLAPESDLTLTYARRVDHVDVEHVDYHGRPVSAEESERLREEKRADRDAALESAAASRRARASIRD